MSDQDVVQKHFVQFYSPGTMWAETSTHEVDSWNVGVARTLARTIEERHGARPYGFRFTTRSRGPNDLDSFVTDISPMHFMGCRVETLDEIEARNDEKDAILISNMKNNGFDRVAITTSGWKWTAQIHEGDVVLEDPDE